MFFVFLCTMFLATYGAKIYVTIFTMRQGVLCITFMTEKVKLGVHDVCPYISEEENNSGNNIKYFNIIT